MTSTPIKQCDRSIEASEASRSRRSKRASSQLLQDRQIFYYVGTYYWIQSQSRIILKRLDCSRVRASTLQLVVKGHMESNIFVDEVGRCYCAKHRRELCHECCLCFDMPNEILEEQIGLSKERSKGEKLAEQHVLLERSIATFMKEDPRTRHALRNEMFSHHKAELKRVQTELKNLKATTSADEVDQIEAALRKERLKGRTQDADRAALLNAFLQQNPGATTMEIGGPDQQRLYEQFVAPPPSAGRDQAVDPYTCSYCKKHSTAILLACGQCRKQAYCNRECQRVHWKAHKKSCVPSEQLSKEDKKRLPITWEQLEEFGTATGEKLEVRFLEQEDGFRLIAQCKDRAGVCKRVAAYTNSRNIPNFGPGKIMVWKNPRFHYFLDGSSGARIEDSDLKDIVIK